MKSTFEKNAFSSTLAPTYFDWQISHILKYSVFFDHFSVLFLLSQSNSLRIQGIERLTFWVVPKISHLFSWVQLVCWNKSDVFWMKRLVPATLHKFNKIRWSFLYRTIAPLYIEFLFLLWCILLMRRRRFSTSISYFLMYAKSFNRKQLFAVWTRISFIMRIHLVSFQTLLCKLKRYVTHIARNSHAHFSLGIPVAIYQGSTRIPVSLQLFE